MRRYLCLSLLLLAARPSHAALEFLDDEAEASCNVSFGLPKGATGQFTLWFDQQNSKNGYLLKATPTNASFVLMQNGVARTLATAPVAWKAQNTVTLQRRSWMMRLLVNDKVALTAYDSTFNSGKVGTESTGWKWKDARLQPVEPIRFDDDFTRAGREGDDSWNESSGKWRLSASSSQITANNAAMSSNPFAFEAASPTGLALASTGRKFWDSYDARVASRPGGKGAIGIAAYVQDPKNYVAFMWSGSEGVSARRIVRVQNGVATTLASAAGAFLPRQWYEIGLRTSPGYVEALIDGSPILRAKDESFGQGGVGLLAQNMDVAAFDDVKVRSYDFYRQNPSAANGAWVARGALKLTGKRDWDGYRLIMPVKMTAKDSIGLVSGYKDDKNYTIFRSAGTGANVPFKGRTQLVRYQNGTPQVLSDAAFLPELLKSPRLTLAAQNGALSVLMGEKVLAQAARPGLTQGLTGLSNAAAFGDESVLYFPPLPDPPKVAERMEEDAYMVGWASPTGEWPPVATDAGLEFWNTGEFFGDAGVEFPWRPNYKGTFEVALRAQRGKFNSGYILRGQSSDDRKSVLWNLWRGDKKLGEARVDLKSAEEGDQEGTLFKLAMQENGMLLYAENAPVMSVLDPSPPTGYALAVRSVGFRIRVERLKARSVNRDDYTFSGAPTDFYAPQGHWSIFSRWPCYGDWSFFGGTGLDPVLWSKRTYGGDVVAEMYAHPQMILPKEPGYTHPGDLNITLCGDGKNLASGYSFVVAGWDNTRSKVMKGSQVLADSTGSEAFFHETINHNTRWHRKWFYIRAEARRAVKDGKAGVQLSLTLDDNPILSAFDPNPLPSWDKGGRVALWTVDSTVMIARAKIEAQKLGLKSLPSGLLDASPVKVAATSKAPQPVVYGDDASAIVVSDQGGWKISNPASGGAFEIKLNDKVIEATPKSRLEIDAAIPAGVKIDAYVTIDGQMHTVELTGKQRPDALAPKLGAMINQDGKWIFDLGSALEKAFPGEKSWKIEKLTLGARHGDVYRWLGFDGNNLGASYKFSGWHVD